MFLNSEAQRGLFLRVGSNASMYANLFLALRHMIRSPRYRDIRRLSICHVSEVNISSKTCNCHHANFKKIKCKMTTFISESEVINISWVTGSYDEQRTAETERSCPRNIRIEVIKLIIALQVRSTCIA